MKLIRFVLLVVVMQPLLSWCQAPQPSSAHLPLQRRYLRPVQKPPVFTIPIAFKEEKVQEEKKAEEVNVEEQEIEVVIPKALRPTIVEIIENLIQYTLDSGEEQKQENIERIIHALGKLFGCDLFTCEQLVKERLGEDVFKQFEVQLREATRIEYKEEHEHDSEFDSSMSKKQKTGD